MGVGIDVPPVALGATPHPDGTTFAGEIFHFESGRRLPGLDPERSDFGSFLSFADPDGNVWLMQEVGRRRPEA